MEIWRKPFISSQGGKDGGGVAAFRVWAAGGIFPIEAASFQKTVSGHVVLNRGAQAMVRTMKINPPETR